MKRFMVFMFKEHDASGAFGDFVRSFDSHEEAFNTCGLLDSGFMDIVDSLEWTYVRYFSHWGNRSWKIIGTGKVEDK